MPQELVAPLAGKVVQIHIEAGATVEEDDEALVIEALKMETSVYAPCNGTISEVRVKVGDMVEEDDVLAIINEGV